MNYMSRIFASLFALFAIPETASEQEVAERLEDEVQSRAREAATPPPPAAVAPEAAPAPAVPAADENTAVLDGMATTLDTLRTEVQELRTANAALAERLAAVENMAAAGESTGEKIPQRESAEPIWMKNPINQKLRRV